MKKIFVLLALIGFAVLLTGCGESTAVGVIGGADGPTAVVIGEQAEPWEYDMYADELIYNYNLYVAAREEFDAEYYNGDANGTIAASDSCIAALEGLVEAVPPAAIAQYHEDVVRAAEYEKEFFNSAKKIAEYSKRANSLTAEENAEAERIGAVITEYYEQPEFSLNDAWVAAFDAATNQ